MTQLFTEDGRAVGVTVISVGPCTVVQRKTVEGEGFDALQLGYGELASERRVTKPMAGHFRRAGEKAEKEIAPCRHLGEFRFADCDAYSVGDQITVDVFEVGERVDVTGTSKGKGFAGVQTGGATDAARVFKGTKKPGHMGNVRKTVRRVRVHMVDAENNLLAVEGSVPGPNGRLVAVWQPAGASVYAAPAGEGE